MPPTHRTDSALDELGELEVPGLPEEADLPAAGPHQRALAGAGPLDQPLYDDDALTNLWRPADTALGPPPQGRTPGAEYPYVPGAGDPAGGVGTVDAPLEPSQVDRQRPAEPELLVRHIVQTISEGSTDFRTFRVSTNSGPLTPAPGSTAVAEPTTVADANPRRNRLLLRNVSATAVSLFVVRGGTGGNGAYLNIGYRLQQNGETLEIKSKGPVEVYSNAATDAVGTLQCLEEFDANPDDTLGVPV